MSEPLVLTDLTEASISGTGVFDVLMRASKNYLDEEFKLQRIRGPEYSQVYLGSLTSVLETAVQFLLNRDKAANEAALIEAQIRETEAKIRMFEIQAQNTILEGQNLVLQGELLAAQKENLDVERAFTVAKTLQTQEQTQLVKQQVLNAMTENDTMLKQQCKLSAEFDVLMETKLKTIQETALLAQRTATERAQTVGLGVDEDSVVGRQKTLYLAQSQGFTRDAEQKVAKLLVDTWNVRRTTDEGTQANDTNKLDDATVGRAVSRLLAGVDA